MNKDQAARHLFNNPYNPELIEKFLKMQSSDKTWIDPVAVEEDMASWFEALIKANTERMDQKSWNRIINIYVSNEMQQHDGPYVSARCHAVRKVLGMDRPIHDNDYEYYATLDAVDNEVIEKVKNIILNMLED